MVSPSMARQPIPAVTSSDTKEVSSAVPVKLPVWLSVVK